MLHQPNRRLLQQGLTLIELLATLAVLSIVLTQGVPSLQTLFLKQRASSQTNQLFLALTLTRNEAIKRGHTATLCASSDGLHCTQAQTDWSGGWLLFIDDNNDQQPNDSDTLIQVQAALSPTTSLSWNRTGPLHFDARGQAVSSNGTFTLCSGSGSQFGRKIIVSNTGRTRVETQLPQDSCQHLSLASQ